MNNGDCHEKLDDSPANFGARKRLYGYCYGNATEVFQVYFLS
jgi:hypothetical protein